jgi:hypothetical protein
MSNQIPDCSELEILLDAFYDNELSQEEEALVSNHVKQCDPCQNKVKQIGQVAVSLRDLPRLSMPKELATDWEAIIRNAVDIPDKELVQEQAPVAEKALDNVVPMMRASAKAGQKFAWRRSLALPVAAATVLLVLATAGMQLRPTPTTLLDQTTQTPIEAASSQDPHSPKLALRSHSSDAVSDVGTSNANGELLAVYSGESNLATEELGISTDEDGLYALKL